MVKPKKYTGTVITNEYLDLKDIRVTIKPDDCDEFDFIPGQFINLRINNGKFRSYSIANLNSPTSTIELIVSLNSNGNGSNYIKSLKIGDMLEFVGPSGRFRLGKPYAENIYFFSTGVGIVPFLPMINKLKNDNYSGKVYIYYGIRHENENILKKHYRNLLDSFENLSIETWISQPKDPHPKTGHITIPANKIVSTNSQQFYICGNPEMISEIKQILTNNGIDKNSMFTEEF